MMNRTHALKALIAIGSAAVGCGGPAPVTEAAMPEQKSAAEAVGDPECSAEMLSGSSSPLIVDWPATARGDLEVTMGQSVAVVSYSCEAGVKLLADCRVAGDYGYAGVSVKSSTISLSSADEVSANLSGGAVLPAAVKAELSRGNSLHLGYFLVGKQSAARPFVARDELEGRCDGATHFVRRADVGAFAMKSGARASFASAVELFGQGAAVSNESSKSIDKRDGDPKSCESADPDAKTPPKSCRALIRVTLLPIDDKPLAKLSKKEREARGGTTAGMGCPAGFIMTGGKCTKPAAEAESVAHLCPLGDAPECRKQCSRGDRGSCDRYAELIMREQEGHLQAKELREQMLAACTEGDLGAACLVAGTLENGYTEKARELFVRGCRVGNLGACEQMKFSVLDPEKGSGLTADPTRYFSVLETGCRAGAAGACQVLAEHYVSGEGVTKDGVEAERYAQRACNGGAHGGCELLAAIRLSEKACKAASLSHRSDGCKLATGSDEKGAVKLLIRACDLDPLGCLPAKSLQDACKDHGLCDAFGGRTIVVDPSTQVG